MEATTKNIIANDISQCNNHSCELRTKCARSLQLGIDYANNDLTHTVTRFGNEIGTWTESCDAQISHP